MDTQGSLDIVQMCAETGTSRALSNVPTYTVVILGLAELFENSAEPQIEQNQVLSVLPESAMRSRTMGASAVTATDSAGT